MAAPEVAAVEGAKFEFTASASPPRYASRIFNIGSPIDGGLIICFVRGERPSGGRLDSKTHTAPPGPPMVYEGVLRVQPAPVPTPRPRRVALSLSLALVDAHALAPRLARTSHTYLPWSPCCCCCCLSTFTPPPPPPSNGPTSLSGRGGAGRSGSLACSSCVSAPSRCVRWAWMSDVPAAGAALTGRPRPGLRADPSPRLIPLATPCSA